MTYGTRPRGDKSGAYLFLPDGEAKPMSVKSPYVRIIEGKLVSFVQVATRAFRHRVFLRSSPGPDGTGLLIANDKTKTICQTSPASQLLSNPIDVLYTRRHF